MHNSNSRQQLAAFHSFLLQLGHVCFMPLVRDLKTAFRKLARQYHPVRDPRKAVWSLA